MNILIISTEPTPYKTDLYNAFCEVPNWNVFVYYASLKGPTPDASHNFNKFPERKYVFSYHHGKGFWGQLFSTCNVIRLLRKSPDFIFVCTMSRLPFIIAILYAVISRIPFALWDDHFKVAQPKFIFMKTIRNLIRYLVFQYSRAVLICGSYGYQTAIAVGCPKDKLVNFPYVVNQKRLWDLANETAPDSGLTAIINNKVVILFSGRMIARKGLESLLMAAAQLIKEGACFMMIIEGDGPLKYKYKNMANELNLNRNIIFAGFSQMDRHAYLLSVFDIVVVLSIEDPWGIVVQEGMILGKAVCASDAVGSAKDMIQNGINGIIFPAGDWHTLANKLKMLLHNREIRVELGNQAKYTAEDWTPKRNIDNFLRKLDIKSFDKL